MRRITALLALLALLLTMLPAATLAAPRDAASLEAVIVVFNDDVESPAAATAELARRHGFDPQFVYEHALKGFAASLPSGALSALSRDPRVAWIEPDQAVHAYELPTGVERIFADDNAEITIDGTDDLRIDVDVAIIDTGIDLDHPDLNVNVAGSVNCLNHSGGPPFSRTYTCEAGGDDDNGHGSHVGGTVGALDDGVNVNGVDVVGVAPGARLWAVKVLDANGSGSLGAVTAGIDYVTANADQIEVANMSLGCECTSAAMDTAIANSVAAGVTYAVAAGNSDADASTHSPANHPDVITVSALADFDGEPGALGSPTCRTDQDDTLADFSNWGSHIEIAAPGVCILSTVPGGGYDGTFSGTSMASPHVAGAAALLASTGGTPATIEATLLAEGNFDWTDDSGDGIQEPLLDVGNAAVFNPATVASPDGGGGDTNAAPTASFTFSCTDLACDFDGSGSSDSDGTIASYAWDFGDGNTGSGATVSHTFAADGTYTVTLTVTDDDGATDSAVADVTVSSPDGGGDGTTFGVTLSGTSTNQGSTWTAIVTITATDDSTSQAAVDGTTVSGSWSTGATDTCTTGETAPGECVVSLGGILKRTGSVTFAVESATDTATSSWDGVKASVIVGKP